MTLPFSHPLPPVIQLPAPPPTPLTRFIIYQRGSRVGETKINLSPHVIGPNGSRFCTHALILTANPKKQCLQTANICERLSEYLKNMLSLRTLPKGVPKEAELPEM